MGNETVGRERGSEAEEEAARGNAREEDTIVDADLCNRYNGDWFFVAHTEVGRRFLSPFKPAALTVINKHGSPYFVATNATPPFPIRSMRFVAE